MKTDMEKIEAIDDANWKPAVQYWREKALKSEAERDAIGQRLADLEKEQAENEKRSMEALCELNSHTTTVGQLLLEKFIGEGKGQHTGGIVDMTDMIGNVDQGCDDIVVELSKWRKELPSDPDQDPGCKLSDLLEMAGSSDPDIFREAIWELVDHADIFDLADEYSSHCDAAIEAGYKIGLKVALCPDDYDSDSDEDRIDFIDHLYEANVCLTKIRDILKVKGDLIDWRKMRCDRYIAE